MDLIVIIIAVTVRLMLTKLDIGFDVDINCFKSWSIMLYEGGLADFYASDAFTDYPPGYMYVLYVIGFIREAFGLAYNSAAFTVLIKLPAILCDVLCVGLIYDLASKRLSKTTAFVIAGLYALNPSVIINSSVWGQVDSVYTVLILFSLLYVTEKKLLPGYSLYALALLVKPQAFMFAPVYLYSACDYLLADAGNAQPIDSEPRPQPGSIPGLWRNKHAAAGLALYCAAALTLLALGTLPFTQGFNLTPVITQYVNTVTSYPYASVNAYNLYGLLGLNWAPQYIELLSMRCDTWGMIFIVLTAAAAPALLYIRRSPDKYFFAAAFINALVFNFSTRMHERYLFPAIALLFTAYALNRSKAVLLLGIGFSGTLFINCIEILSANKTDTVGAVIHPSIIPVSLVNVGLAVFMACCAFKDVLPVRAQAHKAAYAVRLPAFLPVTLITLCYAVIAFMNLGDTSAPQSAWQPGIGGEAIADLGAVTSVTHVAWHNGITNAQRFELRYSVDGATWYALSEPYDCESVFVWYEQPAEFSARYVKVTAVSDALALMELGLKSDGVLLPAAAVTAAGAELFDEQGLIPSAPGHRNSMYFDEVYHARTAYEFAHGLTPYEVTHPPLGKVIISWGILAFGMTAFGYRLMGTLAGVLMLPLIYMFARRFCRGLFWPSFCTLMLAADFMHFSQTRMATVDSFVTLFILAMFYFMYLYTDTPFDAALSKLFVPLALSGLAMGMAVAVKWQGVYAGLGLGLVFFADLYRRRRSPVFKARLAPVLGWCCLCFVAVPVAVYLLAYIPYLQAPGMDGLKSVWDNQLSMFNYHTQLTSTHIFESPWWQWPLNIQPVFLYAGGADGLRMGISTFGNPVVWCAGLVAVIYALINMRDRKTAFLLPAYAAQLLPWAMVSRCTFIYHYFPCVGFMLLLLTYVLARCADRRAAVAIAVAALVMFAVYFPVLSGIPVEPVYVRRYLEWLPTWNII